MIDIRKIRDHLNLSNNIMFMRRRNVNVQAELTELRQNFTDHHQNVGGI